MEESRERKTDPAQSPTREQMFDDVMEKVAALHQANRELQGLIAAVAERTREQGEAILDIQSSMAALWADSTITREQIRPIGVQIGELNARMDRLEERIRDSRTEVTVNE